MAVALEILVTVLLVLVFVLAVASLLVVALNLLARLVGGRQRFPTDDEA